MCVTHHFGEDFKKLVDLLGLQNMETKQQHRFSIRLPNSQDVKNSSMLYPLIVMDPCGVDNVSIIYEQAHVIIYQYTVNYRNFSSSM